LHHGAAVLVEPGADRQHERLALAAQVVGQRVAQQPLGGAAVVVMGRLEEVDAVLARDAHGLDPLMLVEAALGAAKPPGRESESPPRSRPPAQRNRLHPPSLRLNPKLVTTPTATRGPPLPRHCGWA